MKLTLSVLVALVTLGSPAWSYNALSSWTPKSPYRYSSSIHALVRDGETTRLVGTLDDSCRRPLVAHLQRGDTFEARSLEPYLIPIKNFKNPLTQSGHFFHYTNSAKILSVAQWGDYDSMFRFIRLKSNGEYLYVATDDKSTSYYGTYRASVNFSPDSLVLIESGTVPGTQLTWSSGQTAISYELVARYPDLRDCWSGILSLLALEARGVSFRAYYGIDNSEGMSPGAQWFEVLGPWAIQSMTAAAKDAGSSN